MELSGIKLLVVLIISVFGCKYFDCVVNAQQKPRETIEKIESTISVGPKATVIDMNNKFSSDDEKIIEKDEKLRLDFFGDSTGYCRIVEFGQDYYIPGIFYAESPMVCTDVKEGYQALSFNRDLKDELKVIKPKNIEDLYESGWALYFGEFQMSIINKLWDDPNIRYLTDSFTIFPVFDIVNRKEISGIRNMYFGNFNVQPDAYLLIMVKGTYVNKLLFDSCMDCDSRKLKLESPSLYYPMVQPLLAK